MSAEINLLTPKLTVHGDEHQWRVQKLYFVWAGGKIDLTTKIYFQLSEQLKHLHRRVVDQWVCLATGLLSLATWANYNNWPLLLLLQLATTFLMWWQMKTLLTSRQQINFIFISFLIQRRIFRGAEPAPPIPVAVSRAHLLPTPSISFPKESFSPLPGHYQRLYGPPSNN